MYDNIGGKIKGLAKGTFIVETIAAIIGGIVLLVDEFIGLGLLTLFCGPVVAWVSSWLLYGFGELICETSEAKEELMEINRNIYIMAEPMIAKKDEADRQARKEAIERAKQEAIEKVRKTHLTNQAHTTDNKDAWVCSCGYHNSGWRNECGNCFKKRDN